MAQNLFISLLLLSDAAYANTYLRLNMLSVYRCCILYLCSLASMDWLFGGCWKELSFQSAHSAREFDIQISCSNTTGYREILSLLMFFSHCKRRRTGSGWAPGDNQEAIFQVLINLFAKLLQQRKQVPARQTERLNWRWWDKNTVAWYYVLRLFDFNLHWCNIWI